MYTHLHVRPNITLLTFTLCSSEPKECVEMQIKLHLNSAFSVSNERENI